MRNALVRRTVLAASAVSLALLATACGSDKADTKADAKPSEAAATSAAPAAKAKTSAELAGVIVVQADLPTHVVKAPTDAETAAAAGAKSDKPECQPLVSAQSMNPVGTAAGTAGTRAVAKGKEPAADASPEEKLGRHVGYPVALEGALKLKELAYMHAEGFAAGELKHGPIALIEKDLPVVVVVPSPRGRSVLHDKIVSNIQEIRARGARTIVIAEEGDEAVVPYADHLIRIPATPTLLQPLVATVPLQVFACELATARGNEVDQPRNLAKSVTVE
ncbi:hypothetical protein SAVIM40S_05025 [Streptomyces avidinii]